MAYKSIIAMVKPDLTDIVINSAKKVGATGATIIPASGTGAHEAKTFFGLSLDIRTDVVIFLVDDELVEPVLSAIKKAGRFSEPGTGIAFVLAVEQTAGFESQLSKPKL
ncbi:MAG: P-II family nitrogen regulator [Desulfobacterales bacterium]|nr:P-II family nitrogen regulator [Deltaproteobacteria bacterium]NNL43318.1 P-II family nitrogen regulator [Desulfobacterales bacterium]